MSAPRRVRVLVVDDSAFARKVVREVLAARREIEVVDTARDGIDALEKIATLAPDVVTLDLVMPNLDGLGVLASLRPGPGPRVVVVSTASDDSDVVIAALQAGAIAAVRKPTALATDRLYEMSEDLVGAVMHAASARSGIGIVGPARPVSVPPKVRSQTRLVVIGASTGGPQALTRVLAALPASFPAPIAVVLHMPVGYTEAFAKRMDTTCAL
jgi:two-component system chemotaxis response regulator CheB